MKTKTKISIYFTLIFVVVLTVFSASVYYFANRYAFTDFYKRLEIRAVVAAKFLLEQDESDATVLEEVRREHLERLPHEKEYFIRVQDGGNFSKESKELGIPQEFFQEILQERVADYRQKNIFYAGIYYEDNEGNFIVIVSAENQYSTQHFADLRNIFLFVLLFTFIFVFTVASIFSRYVLNPVKSITGQVRDISTRSLHLRLDPHNGNDEITELSNTFNEMLDRLETSFETQKNFVSNASHELRTPLTAIIGETDLALSKPRTSEEYVNTLKTISAEAERLDNITRSLLFLAQTGYTNTKQQEHSVRIDEILWESKKTIDRINPKNQVRIDLSMLPENDDKIKIKGSEDMLLLAFANIIGNACKYSDNKPVEVAVASTDSNVIVIIKDLGIGIPEKDLPHIYDPFFRASNTHKYEGYGIGLPLARNIIRLHKGELDVSSTEHEGTVIQVTFPIA